MANTKLPEAEQHTQYRRFAELVFFGTSPREALKQLKVKVAGNTVRNWTNHWYVRECLERLAAKARARFDVSLDQCVEGIRDAIEQAKIIGDPNAQIKGWTEIARLSGLEPPKRVQVQQLPEEFVQAHRHVSQMSDEALLRLATSEDVVEGDWESVSGTNRERLALEHQEGVEEPLAASEEV